MTQETGNRKTVPAIAPLAHWKPIGIVVQVLLPSIKMKSHSRRGIPFERQFHDFLLSSFGGYTVTSGNITGYWLGSSIGEECNEHREYQIAIARPEHLVKLGDYLGRLARELNERTIFCTMHGEAFLISAAKTTRAKQKHSSRTR
jgi:hypothetical protein